MNEFKLTEGDAASRHGRVHYRTWEGVDAKAATPVLILLHPMPHDGAFFSAIAPYMARGRTVIAPDYPGYGGSDALEESPAISLYAEATIDALGEAGLKGPFDFLGFHTGCLVAVEISLLFPGETCRLVQIDVPYFDKAMRQELMASDMAVGGFIAAFSYVGEERYPAVQHDSLVIATASSLLEPSRVASTAIPGCRFKELPEVEAPALENGAESIAGIALNFLDQ